MVNKPRKGAGLDRLLAIWNRRKWLAIVAFAAPLTVGLSFAAFIPRIYRATATVLVDGQQLPEKFVAPTVTSALETRLQTISQEVLSRSRLEELIQRFGLYHELRKQVSSEEVIERMRSDIKLELKGVDSKGQRGVTVAFKLSYVGSSPQTVALVTNTLASFYITENLKVRERQAAGTAEFLRVQLEDTRNRLDDQERRVSAFKRRYLGELPQQMEANLATLERLNMQLRLNADGQRRAQERRTFFKAQLDELALSDAPTASPQQVADSFAVRLEQQRLELAELRARYLDTHPDVIQKKAEIAHFTRARETPPDKGAPGPGRSEEASAPPKSAPERERIGARAINALPAKLALAEAETELKVLKTEDSQLRAAIASYQQRVEKIPQREQEFTELARDYASTRDLYQTLLQRHEEAVIAESMEQRQKGEQFRVIEPAIAPTHPVAHRVRLVILTLVLAVGLSATAVMFAEQVDRCFHTIDELRAHSGAPLLVNIPRIVTDEDAHRRRWRFRLAVAAATLGIIVLVGASYFIAHDNEQLVWLLSRGA